MKALSYARPSTRNEAAQLLAKNGKAAVLAGGTDLLSLLKDGVVQPDLLVDIKSIRSDKGVSSRSGGGIRIGALTTIDELLAESAAGPYTALVQAAAGIHSPQIRSRGTVGGELCQRPRCWYYRNGFGLLASHNGESMPEKGDNRYHAILGHAKRAYFVNPSSLAPALIALQARLTIAGAKKSREVALEKFYQVPESNSQREYKLEHDEIVTEVLLPDNGGVHSATYEVREREALDWPLVGASVALQMDGETVRSARIVLGHVAPVPWIAEKASSQLKGKKLDAAAAAAAGEAAVEGAQPLSQNGYKVVLARTAVKRALLKAKGEEV